ncbi:MAG: SH3 domain-containing protein [Sarcina sp.]
MKHSKLISMFMLGTIVTAGIVGSNLTTQEAKAEVLNKNVIETQNGNAKEEGSFIVTARSGANLRKGPGTNYGIIKAFPKGTVLWRIKPLPDKNGWYNVETEDGRYRGWMHESTGVIS